jgi:hypothetical protein
MQRLGFGVWGLRFRVYGFGVKGLANLEEEFVQRERYHERGFEKSTFGIFQGKHLEISSHFSQFW